ncbi:hypothetical protein [Aliamphritea spongicola]|nr:hypothetical protein [Aliamphritea spongicola]
MAVVRLIKKNRCMANLPEPVGITVQQTPVTGLGDETADNLAAGRGAGKDIISGSTADSNQRIKLSQITGRALT